MSRQLGELGPDKAEPEPQERIGHLEPKVPGGASFGHREVVGMGLNDGLRTFGQDDGAGRQTTLLAG